MVEALTSRWWLFLIRGIIAVLCGVAAAMWPQVTLPVLVVLFGVYALIDGIFALTAGLSPFGGTRWWALLVEGILGLVVAFYVFTQPVLSALAFVYAVGLWSVLTGITEIVAGLQLRDVIANEWLYVVGGIVSIAFGVLVVRYPEAGALAIVWLFGFYVFLFGLLQLALAYRLHRLYAGAHRVHAA